MTTVFVGGSREISRLNPVTRAKLDDLISRNCTFLVGDANGADKVVQQYLSGRGYRNVVVYCMDRCRNNLGVWPTRRISRPGAPRDFAYYAVKDHQMAEEAKCGVMFWDGKSKGTLNNIQNLVRLGKRTLVYMAPEKAFHKVSSAKDLDELLDRCDRSVIERAQRQIGDRISSQGRLAFHPTQS